jgi:hypothetical protein
MSKKSATPKKSKRGRTSPGQESKQKKEKKTSGAQAFNPQSTPQPQNQTNKTCEETQKMDKLEKKMDQLLKGQDGLVKGQEVLKQNLDGLREDCKRTDQRVARMDEKIDEQKEWMIEELRSREENRKKIVIYGLDKNGDDKELLEKTFSVDKDDIKFVGRLKPKGDRPPPMVVRFKQESTKDQVLSMKIPNVSTKPFLTKVQQEEGQRLFKEMTAKNERGEGPYRMVGAPGLWKLVGPKKTQ